VVLSVGFVPFFTQPKCQRQNNSEPKGNAIYCHFAVGIITA
jgi:hypothetical protein